MIKLMVCLPFVITGVIFLLTPNMTRRGLLFAVPVSDDFRDSEAGRRAIAVFRMIVAMAMMAGVGLQLALPAGNLDAAAPILLLPVAAIAYYKAKGIVAPFRVSSDGERSVEMSAAPEQMPNRIWLAVGPFLLLGLAAFYLYLHWANVPERFPVHWGIDGEPNRWSQKSTKGVFGPIFLGAEICAWLAVSAVIAWYGARRSPLRSRVLELMIAVEYVIGFTFGFVALLPVLNMPAWSIVFVALAPLPILILYIMKKTSEPSGGIERTPEECWKAGLFYYNPNDMALFVEKRTGYGYTFNFANRWSWALMGGLILMLATIPVFLH